MATREDVTDVVIYTHNFLIRGAVALMPGARLTDYVRSADSFIAVTDAVVCGHDGKERFRTQFLDVHRDHIELVVLREMMDGDLG